MRRSSPSPGRPPPRRLPVTAVSHHRGNRFHRGDRCARREGRGPAGIRRLGVGTGAARAAYRDAGGQTVIKPKPLHPAVPGGFTPDDFTVDEPAGMVTCPAGHTRPMSQKRTAAFGRLCAHCPLRQRCTTAAGGRSMSIHPHEQLLRAARAQARTPQFKRAYPTRSSAERIIAWVATQQGAVSGSATSASKRTMPGCATGPPRSTCAPSSTPASPAATEPGRWPDGKGRRRPLIGTRP
jgi:Transposase DDE domain